MKVVTVIKHNLDCEAGKQTPFSVLARFFTWQIWRRVLRKPMSFTTVTGTKLRLLPGASDSLSGFWYQQLPDFDELCFALHLLRRGELFIDVGANQGGWTVTVAGRAEVFAFEPVPITRNRLEVNVAANPEIQPRVRVFVEALGEQRGEVQFTVDLDSGNHQIMPEQATKIASVSVPLRTMDEILELQNPVLIKIDVEGAEQAVLRGASIVLRKPSLLALVVETFRPHNFSETKLQELEKLLNENGFFPHTYNPWKRCLSPLLSPSGGGQNTIYVRSDLEIRTRLQTAEPICAFRREI